jgi:hypothetical protein
VVNFIGDGAFQKLNEPLEKGEPVYKIGRSTGLSVGRLKDPSVNFKKANGKCYYYVAIVDGLFSFHGDCGALYCVMRIIPPEMTDLFGDVQGFYPFAVHRNSVEEVDSVTNVNETLAIGQDLWIGLDTLGLDFSFRNTSWNRFHPDPPIP